jgi:hypothetical protein
VGDFSLTLSPDLLLFDSRFESGNLRRVYKMAEDEYNLILDFDLMTDYYT